MANEFDNLLSDMQKKGLVEVKGSCGIIRELKRNLIQKSIQFIAQANNPDTVYLANFDIGGYEDTLEDWRN